MLHQNFPNPFNPLTTIRYVLPVNTIIELNLFNSAGQKIKNLYKGYQAAGNHEIELQAAELSSGIYFYELSSNAFIQRRKLILLKKFIFDLFY